MILGALFVAACLPLIGDSDQITAADLARGEPGFAALAPETPLAVAPLPGVRRLFTVPELEKLAARHGVSLEARQPLCVERTVAPLDPARLLAALQSALGIRDSRVEIVEYSRYPAPRGTIEFARSDLPVPPPGSRPQNAVLWKGAVRYGAGSRFVIWARVRVMVRVDCIVAGEALPAGRAIESAWLQRQAYEGFPLPTRPITSIEEAAGHVPRRPIPKGAPVLADVLDPPYDVARGETVEVEVASGDAHLRLEARAEAGGRIGQVIAVLNPASGKRFPARISSPGRVVVGVHP